MRKQILGVLVVAACTGGETETGGFGAGDGVPVKSMTTGSSAELPTTGEPGPGASTGESATTGGVTPGETDATGTGEAMTTTADDSTTAATTGDADTNSMDAASVEIDAAGVEALQVGMLGALTASALDEHGQPIPDAAIVWRSSDGLAVYVDDVGGLLGVSEGEATITAESGGVTSAPVKIPVVKFKPPAASFSEVRALAVSSCALAGCHVDGTEAGDLRWDRPADKLWDELGEAASSFPSLLRVQAGEPRASYVIHKLALDEPEVGERMPFGGPRLTAAEAQVFVRWIVDGAPFN